MELPSIKLHYKNKIKNKKGELPLILQITFNRKLYTKALGIVIPSGLLSGNEITGNDKLTMLRNIKIRNTISDLMRQFIDLMANDQLDNRSIKAVIAGEKVGMYTMLDLFSKIELIYKGVLSNVRIRCIRSSVNKFHKWSKGMPLKQITPAILLSYEGYLRNDCEHAETSVWSDIMDLKSVCNKAIAHKIIKEHPFEGYKAPAYRSPKRSFMSEEEVDKIEAYADNEKKNQMLRLVASWFVLACYSGLRYGDLYQWEESKMVKNGTIYLSDEKTKTPHFIPLYPKLKKAIERVRNLRSIPENQVCNRALKEIANSEDCNISTIITMHVARHTFAVTYLNNGGTKEVLQKLMGHKKIETTEVYSQITDKRINDEVMRVLNLK